METASIQEVAKQRHRLPAAQVVAFGLVLLIASLLNAKAPDEPLPAHALLRLGATPFCSPDGIVWCVRSPDGKFFAVQSSDSLLIIDAATGRRLRQAPIAEPLKWGRAALTPDSKELVRAHGAGVDIWKVDTLRSDRMLWRANDSQRYVGISADGKTAVVTSLNEIKVFQLADGKVLRETKLGRFIECRACLSDDGRFMAVWGLRHPRKEKLTDGDPRQVEIWEIEAKYSVFKVIRAVGMPSQVVFSPDGSRIATFGSRVLQVWDGKNGEMINRAETDVGGDVRLCFSRDGKKIAIAGSEGKAAIFVAETGKLIERGSTPLTTIDGIACDEDGVFRAWGHAGKAIVLWEVPSGKLLTPTRDHPAGISDLQFSADGNVLYTAGFGSSRVLAWDIVTGARPRQLVLRDRDGLLQGQVVVFASGAESIAVADADETAVSIHSGSDGSKRFGCQVAKGHLDRHQLFFSPDGRKLTFLSHFAGTLDIWDVPSGKAVRALEQLSPGCGWKTGAFSVDGKLLAAANSTPGISSHIPIFDIDAAKRIAQVEMHDAQAQSLKFLDGRRFLALGWRNGNLHHFDAWTGKPLRAFEAIPDTHLTGKLVLSRDGRLVAAGARADESHEGKAPPRVLVWEVASGRLRHVFEGHAGQIEALAFSPDGARLASGASDTTVLLWGLRGAREKPVKSTAELWADLEQLDARAAETAIRQLVSRPEMTVAFLKENLHPVAKLDDELIQKLLVDLEADRFAVRDAATKQLEKIGAPALPAIEKALQAKPNADLGERLEKLRATFNQTDPDETTWRQDLRPLRALEALERIGSAEARAVVKTLATGADGAKPTRAAREALERLK